MRSFKRAVKSTIAFLLVLAALSAAIIEPVYIARPNYFQDADVRRELSGSLDYIICGASHAIRALDPRILDECMGVNSYNLSGSLLSMQGRYFLLQKELARNPVKTVVLELSCNTMQRDAESSFEGDYYVLARCDTIFERYAYMFSAIPAKKYGLVYYYDLSAGIKYLAHQITGDHWTYDKYGWKGFYPWQEEPTDLSRTTEELAQIYNTQTVGGEIQEENREYVDKIIALCKAQNVRLILITTPISKQRICEYSDLDVYRAYYAQLAEENGVPFYDFNLLKDRDNDFTDEASFSDDFHMSEDGAAAFSARFAQIMNLVDQGQDVSGLFYRSYGEMEAQEEYTR